MADPIKLLPYQRDGVLAIEAFGMRALVADEMGLGKTIQALVALWRNPQFLPACVVCPAVVKSHWAREALDNCGLRSYVCEGRTPPDQDTLGQRPHLFIINYDILPYWVPWLRAQGIQCVLVDECHRIQNVESQWSQSVHALCQQVPGVICLSGTPLTNRPAELWSAIHLIRPDVYNSRFSFLFEYTKPRRRPWARGGWVYEGAAKVPKLHKELTKNMMIRRRKADVLDQLPRKVRRVVPVQLSDWDEYRTARDDFVNWLRRIDVLRARRASRAQQLVKVGYLLRLVARLKLRGVVEWVNRFLEESEPDRKLLMFAVHQKMIEAMRRRVGTPSVVVDGSVTGKDRDAAIQQFQRGKTRLAICNIHAGGVGWNANVCSDVGMCELWWRPGDMAQAEDRPHRIGQNEEVWINYLVVPGTIEEKLCRVLTEKQRVISGVLDGGRREEDLDILDQVLAALLEEES